MNGKKKQKAPIIARSMADTIRESLAAQASHSAHGARFKYVLGCIVDIYDEGRKRSETEAKELKRRTDADVREAAKITAAWQDERNAMQREHKDKQAAMLKEATKAKDLHDRQVMTLEAAVEADQARADVLGQQLARTQAEVPSPNESSPCRDAVLV